VAVQLTAAAAALRGKAGLPPLPSPRTESYLAPAGHLGEPAIARLWAHGLAMTSETAVTLALDASSVAPDAGHLDLTIVSTPGTVGTPRSPLTSREHQIATLVADGRTNKAIADELSISPETTVRHITNILASSA
jgi:DNA-binding CsgD family transcriptional regulator